MSAICDATYTESEIITLGRVENNSLWSFYSTYKMDEYSITTS